LPEPPRPHLLRRCFSFSSDGAAALAMISPALREKASVSMGETGDVSRCDEGWGSIFSVPRLSAGGFFFMFAECNDWNTVPYQGQA
jgi:hypothetical protein